MISICMATYNGERFIEEQLKCIYEQTLQPDEVIICDDDSTDRTRDMIEGFICKHELQDKWHLLHNPVRKGYPGNFYYCMSLAKGDIVFLADQDDVWSNRKLETMCHFIQQNEAMQVLACKMELIDVDGQNIKTLVKPNYSAESGQVQEIGVDKVLYKNEWSGMVLGYRNHWYQSVKSKIEHTKLPHDLAISALAADEKGMYQLDSVLAYHRRHDNNAAGEEHRIGKLLNKQRKIKEIEDYLGILNGFAQGKLFQTEEGKEALQRKLRSMQGRYDALKSGKITKVLKNAWQQRGSVRLATVLCDVLIVKK